MLTLFSRKSILGCTQQVRDLSLLSRSAINTIKSLTPVPKTTANSYSLFYKEQFPEFKKQFPDFSLGEIGKRIGSKWTSLSESTKKSYKDRATPVIEKAKAERDQFKGSLTERQVMALRMIRVNTQARRGFIGRRDLSEEEAEFLATLPKSPFSSGRAIFFSNELRKKGDKTQTELLSSAQKAWLALSDAQKAQYEEQAAKDQKLYYDSMKKFLLHNA